MDLQYDCIFNAKVSDQLNRLYLKFVKRDPGYDGKVSLYGHSLGSVLSYDIICHQENLSSPFPMEWMYKEQHLANEESSSPTLNNQSADCNFKSSHNKNVGSLNNQTKGMVGPSEEDNPAEKPTFPVPEMEDSSFPTGFSVPLDLDEPSAMEVESKQSDAIDQWGKMTTGRFLILEICFLAKGNILMTPLT
ncbi:phospholipase SGR2-like [Rhododendron vialii]|uniref:phospholipase SGR2-like n=1 Tax=Rhododendron vialii TaxID=182163 RepID=UPI00265DF671|nr:phospholipase SGR2-like [Rhododendron vialii]